MDKKQIIETAQSIEDKFGDLKFTLDTLTDEIRSLQNEIKRHENNEEWYESAMEYLEDAKNSSLDAYDNIDTCQSSLNEIQN